MALAQLSVRPEEPVLIILPDSPDFVDAFTSAMQRGAVPLPANPQLPAADVTAVAIEIGARLVLVSAERIHQLADLEAEPPVLVAGLPPALGSRAAAAQSRRQVPAD